MIMAAVYRDYYKILGVERNATDKEIKSAYRKLAREYHPDLHQGDAKKGAEDRFKEINEAYEVLSDQEKRKKYDTLGANWQHGQEWQPPGGDGYQYYTWNDGDRGGFGSTGFDAGGFSDFFDILFGGGGIRFNQGDGFTGDGFTGDGFTGGGFADALRANRNMGGQDMESELELSLEEAYRGGEKILQLADAGTRLTVKIPAGVKEGGKIRLKGQGQPGLDPSKKGDLLLKIKIKPHSLFTLKDYDLETTVRLTPEQAVLGVKTPVPTLDGEVLLNVPPLTHAGQKLRLREKGWPKKGGGRGDAYITVLIDIPAKLSPEETALYVQLAQLKAGNS
jgi:curved DNA-binding protein